MRYILFMYLSDTHFSFTFVCVCTYRIKCKAAPKSSIVCDSLKAIATFSTPPRGERASLALLPNSFSK